VATTKVAPESRVIIEICNFRGLFISLAMLSESLFNWISQNSFKCLELFLGFYQKAPRPL
jgi:hypothetical protein